MVRRLKYSDLVQVQGIWTARKLEMHDLRRNSRTILALEKLQYNVPLKEEDFTLQALRNHGVTSATGGWGAWGAAGLPTEARREGFGARVGAARGSRVRARRCARPEIHLPRLRRSRLTAAIRKRRRVIDDRVALEGRVRFEPAYKPAEWLTFVVFIRSARRTISGQVERQWRIDIRDRSGCSGRRCPSGRPRPQLRKRGASPSTWASSSSDGGRPTF